MSNDLRKYLESGLQPNEAPMAPMAKHDAGPQPALRATRLDAMRALATEAVARVERASGPEHAKLLIQLRALQDEIAHLKHRHPIMAEAPSGLAWADDWSPPS